MDGGVAGFGACSIAEDRPAPLTHSLKRSNFVGCEDFLTSKTFLHVNMLQT